METEVVFTCLFIKVLREIQIQPPIGRTHSWRFSISFIRIKHRPRANDFFVKLSINNHIVGLVHKKHIIRTCLMYHAACKVEFQPFKRSYSLKKYIFKNNNNTTAVSAYDQLSVWLFPHLGQEVGTVQDLHTRSTGARWCRPVRQHELNHTRSGVLLLYNCLEKYRPRSGNRSIICWNVVVSAQHACVRSQITVYHGIHYCAPATLSLIHIWRCRRYAVCRSRWSPYH